MWVLTLFQLLQQCITHCRAIISLYYRKNDFSHLINIRHIYLLPLKRYFGWHQSLKVKFELYGFVPMHPVKTFNPQKINSIWDADPDSQNCIPFNPVTIYHISVGLGGNVWQAEIATQPTNLLYCWFPFPLVGCVAITPCSYVSWLIKMLWEEGHDLWE